MALFELSRLGKIIKKNINMTAEEYIASKRHEDHIDWEQIRIQAAIATMQNLCGCERFLSYSEEDIAKFSVKQADALINELKKKK